MATARALEPELISGERMSRERFLRVWDRLPELRFAELIEGTVYLASPVPAEHGFSDLELQTWLGVYAARTPGLRAGSNMTWLMLESAPQPDICLVSIPVQLGGRKRNLASGKPDLIVEVTLTSHTHDYGPKKALYQRAGVREYVTVDALHRKVVWRRLIGGSYRPLVADREGIFRSVSFPGLWLNSRALWEDDGGAAQVLLTLEAGLASPEYAAFLRRRERAKLKK